MRSAISTNDIVFLKIKIAILLLVRDVCIKPFSIPQTNGSFHDFLIHRRSASRMTSRILFHSIVIILCSSTTGIQNYSRPKYENLLFTISAKDYSKKIVHVKGFY